MGERSVRPRGSVDADAAGEIRMTTLHALCRREDYLRIAMIDPPIAIEVVHPAVTVVVDEDVGGVAVLMPAILARPTVPHPPLGTAGSGSHSSRSLADGNPSRCISAITRLHLSMSSHEDEIWANAELILGQEVAAGMIRHLVSGLRRHR